MNGLLLRILDDWRAEANSPCHIHAGYDLKGHSEYSYHKLGDAVDVDFRKIPLWEAYSALQKVLERYNLQDKVGIGIYFWWNHPGFHLDLRGFELTWYSEKSGSYIYDKTGAITKMKSLK